MAHGRVMAAMSGGVDSSVAAALLLEQGYEVIGVGLRLGDGSSGVSTCCGMGDLQDARAVAAQIGIPFYILDYRKAFRRDVVGPFCEAYAKGRTPNPCILCNEYIKFGRLLKLALALGMDYMATGHYAGVRHGPDESLFLCRGMDLEHDQSYFLYSLSRQQLAHALFPLQGLQKGCVRELARRYGFPVADKPSSQDICFVGSDGYRHLVAQSHPEALRPGPIVDTQGHVLGRHRGLGAYTIGQRRGLGVAAGERLYVVALDFSRNAIVVGTQQEAQNRILHLERVCWHGQAWPTTPIALWAKARYRGKMVRAEVCAAEDGLQVTFEEPQAVAPGQAVVFYEGEIVLGGGVVSVPSPSACAEHVEREGCAIHG